jgi:hypothetical protein
LAQEWDEFATQRRACVADLATLEMPTHEVIDRTLDIWKAHLLMLCKPMDRLGGYQNPTTAIEQVIAPITRNPRGGV